MAASLHYNNIIGAIRLLQVQSLNVSSCEKRDHFGLCVCRMYQRYYEMYSYTLAKPVICIIIL